jgi:hypothetical protein
VKDEIIMFVRRKRPMPRTDTVHLSKEALDLLKRESVAFAHLPSSSLAQGTGKGNTELTSTLPKATAAAVIRRYVKGN